ncbi:cholecystokinin receptor type A [Patella vulgata]|uniref:cholecystokinin receptor type A n=1 Tax=Patella vulgata TaxID=6465 RepID=UPI0021800981|nr:cholecystokinin receptor type A [Patella vulgata]
METVSGSAETMIILIIMLSTFALVGSIGNGLSTFVFYKIRDKTSAQIFILTLSVIDLFTCTVIIPFTIVMEYLNYTIKYDAICKLYQFLITSKVPLSAFMMVAIAFDRYFCICHSLRRIVNPFRTKIAVACMVIFACVLGIITSLNYGVYWKGDGQSASSQMGNSSYQYSELMEMLHVNGGEYAQFLEFIQSQNATNISLPIDPEQKDAKIIYTGECQVNKIILHKSFVPVYQKIYSFLFVVCLIIGCVLYALIYRFIKTRRSKKLKQKLILCTYTHGNQGKDATKSVVIPDDEKLKNKESHHLLIQEDTPKPINDIHCKEPHRFSEKAEKLRDEARAANIKTAFMLFIVSVVYILAFSPAWLMAHHLIPTYKVIFYLYFIYNVANPFIYAFMNQTFNEHLKQIFRCCKR